MTKPEEKQSECKMHHDPKRVEQILVIIRTQLLSVEQQQAKSRTNEMEIEGLLTATVQAINPGFSL